MSEKDDCPGARAVNWCVEGLELAFSEIVVALVSSGALSRHDTAKALLRAEVMAATRDDEEGQPGRPRATYVRLLQAQAEVRLGLMPNFRTLRKQQEAWREGQGEHPLQEGRPPEDLVPD